MLRLNKGDSNLPGTTLISLRSCDSILKSILGLDPNEAHLYLLITNSGKMTISKISETCNWSSEEARLYSIRLVEKGMFIEINNGEFESLHPRFALSNRYRKRCEDLGVKFGRNDQVDSLAIYLEKYYYSARTK